jgi:hypothetical protein
MKKILAIALLCTAFAAHGEGLFIGADIGSVTYPDYTSDLTNTLLADGASFTDVSQNVSAFTVGFHVGQWVTDSFGWEAGYTDLGSVDGTYNSDAPVIGNSGTYSYSASAFHVAVLGGIPMGRGELFGKAGVFSARTTLNDNCPGCIPSQSASSTGFLFGGGYELWFNHNVSARFGLNIFNGVKFVNVATYTYDYQTMVQAAVGVNYSF